METTINEIESILPLTPTQEGILYHSLRSGNPETYFEQCSVMVKGEVNLKIFEESLNYLIHRHQVLRNIFVYENVEDFLQITLEQRIARVACHDFSHLELEEQSAYIERLKAADRTRGFKLQEDLLIRATLVKLGQNRYMMIWSYHHIILDGWSMGILFNEFLVVYQSLSQCKQPSLDEAVPFGIFVKWVEEQKDYKMSSLFWKGYLDGLKVTTGLPALLKQKKSGFLQKQFEFSLGEEWTNWLIVFAKDNKISISNLIQALWGILLSRYNSTNDVLFGLVVSGRNPAVEGIEKMPGLFVNTVPLRMNIPKGIPFSNLLKQIQKESIETTAYSHYPLNSIQAMSPLQKELFDNILVIQNYPINENIRAGSEESGLPFEIEETHMTGQTNYNCTVTVPIMKDGITFHFRYNANVYQPEFIESISCHLRSLIQQVLDKPEMPVEHMEISSLQQHLIPYSFNNVSNHYYTQNIHQIFEQQAELSASTAAVVFDNKTFNYNEINRHANRLARYLRDRGVGPERVVALLLEPSVDMIVGVLGVLKAGGAYLPIDPELPEARIKYFLQDSQTALVLTNMDEVPPGIDQDVINLADIKYEDYDDVNLLPLAERNHMAYLIYTSGSTGTPKGVVIEHQAVVNFIEGMNEKIDFVSQQTILCSSNFSFDIFVMETLLPLCIGMTVVIASKEEQKNPRLLAQLIGNERIKILQFTPSKLKLILSDNISAPVLQKVNIVITGGEPLSPPLLQQLRENTRARVYNVYGPTECTVYATVEDMTDKDDVTIGGPITNMQIYIMDHNMCLQPPMVYGELYISGTGLARGYTQPGLTTDRFVYSRHSQDIRIYKTGDIARWGMNGELEIAGRMDDQIKIRGYRIELGEIENVMLGLPGITNAVAVVTDDDNEHSQIVAFYISGTSVTPSELRERLEQLLPQYMIPGQFFKVDQLPLTANEKIHKNVLAQMARELATSVIAMEQEDMSYLEDEDFMNIRQILVDILSVEPELVKPKVLLNDLGMYSLEYIKLIVIIEQITDIAFDDGELAGDHLSTVEDLVTFMKSKKQLQSISERDDDL